MGLLAKKTHSILFPNQLIRLVYQHSVFLGRLEERLNNWHHVQKIGDLFSGFKEETKGGLFKVYLSYITHFPLLFEKLSKMSTTNERFRHYIQKCRQEVAACQRLSLLSLLYNPIQRLPQYLMLLKTYSKHLDPQHADCDPVHSATTSLQTLLFMANKLCNFRKEGPGAIKLPPTTSAPHQSSDRRSSDSATPDNNATPDSNHPAVERKPTHHRKLSTLLNVLTFSSVIKKRKKDRDKNANSSSCVSCSTD
ncbi:FYVE, RhoGEF and PH domain-containing protein 4-like [Bolinopsis microptera]|uniref:FYVE, RhoGEF and PH domain-containing protein 4-like n=1 Tax=Bolinopsis microptera TaxID=2820187 RepID=UPI00307AA640